MCGESDEIESGTVESWVKMVGGIQACRKVQEASSWPSDDSEDWLRKAIWNLAPRAWHKPLFLGEYQVQQDHIDRTFPIMPGDEIYSDMNDFDLTDVCMTEASLDEAITASFTTTASLADGVASDIPFLVAANHVAQHLGVPVDAATAALSNAISAGAVKAWRLPNEYDPKARARGRPMASEIFRTIFESGKQRIDLGPRRRMYKTDERDVVVDIASMSEWMIRFGLALGSPNDCVAPRDDREHTVCEMFENDKAAPPSEKIGDNNLSPSDSTYDEQCRKLIDEMKRPEPPRPSVLFAIACDSVQKRANYSEKAAEAWLSEAIPDRLEAWIYSASTSGLNEAGWIRIRDVREAERLYVSIEDLEGALAAEFPAEKPNQKPKKKRGPRPMDIGLTVVAEATRWADNEALNPGAHGALQRVRDYMTDRLIDHKHEHVSPGTVRKWAQYVLDALKGQNVSN